MDDGTLLEKARWLAEQRDFGPPLATNLTKTCPRCGRKGEVFLSARNLFIVWEGPGRAREVMPDLTNCPFDAATTLSADDLLNPKYGCGFDKQP